MVNQSPKSLIRHFSTIDDPRVDRSNRHKVIDILSIAICATICGAETREGFQLFGHAKIEWFKTFLELPNSIPSHDRIRKDRGPENMTTLSHIALNLLKQDKSIKVGIKSKRKYAGWNERYLLKVLYG